MVSDDEILEAIRWYVGEHGYSPTLRELCKMVGIKAPSSMKYRLDQLRDKGLITGGEYHMPRTIRVVQHD